MKILHAIGARPNLVKAAPLVKKLDAHKSKLSQRILHTGQHYDSILSDIVLENLGLIKVDYQLTITRTSASAQIADIMMKSEQVFEDYQPDLTFIYGDVNSSLAVALVAKKMNFIIAHVESGLRSRDQGMQEEINRVAIDHMSDYLLTPSRDASENLANEGLAAEKIRFVGNIMIDSLVENITKADLRFPKLRHEFKIDAGYVLVTLHRPSNVNDPVRLNEIMNSLASLSKETVVLFPVHPRTRAQLSSKGFDDIANLRLCEPFAYLDFLAVMKNASLVLTDSGGVQEETTFLNVKCLTLRPNTERPITIIAGSNTLVPPGTNILTAAKEALSENIVRSKGDLPLWDGKTSDRITSLVLEIKP